MPTYSRPPASAMAVIRSAMARPPVLGSTFRPNLTGCVMGCSSSARGSVLCDSGARPGEHVQFGGRQRVQQELADRLRVHARGAAEHVTPVLGNAYQHPAPVVGGAGAGQPAAAAEPRP